MLLLLFTGASANYTLDVSKSLADVAYRLGFASLSDLISDAEAYTNVAELYQFADDGAKKIAYESGVFQNYDTSVSVTPGTAVYALPATHVFTVLAVLIDGTTGAPQLLRPTAVRNLWALDANWPTTTGSPNRCSLDAGGVGTITLYPVPIAGSGGTLGQVCQEFPSPGISQGFTLVPLSVVLQDYFSYCMLAGARGKESEAAMPDMAAHFQSRCDLYGQIVEHLWGAGQ
jgi:hypothetical protein